MSNSSCYSYFYKPQTMCPKIGPEARRSSSSCYAPAPQNGKHSLCSTQSGGVLLPQYRTPQAEAESTQRTQHIFNTYPAQEGYQITRCTLNRNLHPQRPWSGYLTHCMGDQTDTQPTPKPELPPLATPTKIHSYGSGTQVAWDKGAPSRETSAIKGQCSTMINSARNQPTELRYIMNSNIAPSYYLDLTQKPIGNRPVHSARVMESDIPHILVKNLEVNRNTHCYQPTWGKSCI